jgi:alkylation response protein AidB-like acyl-CoA dehydrogenase
LTANWLFTLVRTKIANSGSAGLYFALIPLDQPGVEVRGITDMTGDTDWTEVFFTDAVAQTGNFVSVFGNGAAVALSLLGLERGAGGWVNAVALSIELERLEALIRARRAEMLAFARLYADDKPGADVSDIDDVKKSVRSRTRRLARKHRSN